MDQGKAFTRDDGDPEMQGYLTYTCACGTLVLHSGNRRTEGSLFPLFHPCQRISQQGVGKLTPLLGNQKLDLLFTALL